VSRDAAARELVCTVSKIGDIETGRSGVKPVELERLLNLYGATGDDREALIATAHEARRRRRPGSGIPVSHRRYLDLETQARSVTFFSPGLLPAALQTDGYARALLEWPGRLSVAEVDAKLALRAELRKNLSRLDPSPPSYWCIVGEAALRAGVGGPVVMAEQLEYLLEWSRRMHHLVIQVLPLRSGAHGFMGWTHTLLRFEPPARDIVHMDSSVRDLFFDGEAEVREVAEKLELMKAQAIGRNESLALITEILEWACRGGMSGSPRAGPRTATSAWRR
jgi:hypothetical protein